MRNFSSVEYWFESSGGTHQQRNTTSNFFFLFGRIKATPPAESHPLYSSQVLACFAWLGPMVRHATLNSRDAGSIPCSWAYSPSLELFGLLSGTIPGSRPTFSPLAYSSAMIFCIYITLNFQDIVAGLGVLMVTHAEAWPRDAGSNPCSRATCTYPFFYLTT